LIPGIGCSPPAYHCYQKDQCYEPARNERKRLKKKRRRFLQKRFREENGRRDYQTL
jgi:hypothetical protein